MREIKFRVWDDGMLYLGSSFDSTWLEEKTCMQYTGLKDLNGREVYEGDILRQPPDSEWDKTNYACHEVFWHDGDASTGSNIGFHCCRNHFHGSVCGGTWPSFKPKQVSGMIIIGNIYENPELLINTGQKNEAKPML